MSDETAQDPIRSVKSAEEDDGGPIGIFPNWRWVYTSVIVYTFLMIVVLYIFTILTDHGGP